MGTHPPPFTCHHSPATIHLPSLTRQLPPTQLHSLTRRQAQDMKPSAVAATEPCLADVVRHGDAGIRRCLAAAAGAWEASKQRVSSDRSAAEARHQSSEAEAYESARTILAQSASRSTGSKPPMMIHGSASESADGPLKAVGLAAQKCREAAAAAAVSEREALASTSAAGSDADGHLAVSTAEELLTLIASKRLRQVDERRCSF